MTDNLKWMMILGATLAGISAFAQEDWKLKNREQGVTVYTRSTSNSNFNTVRTVCTLQTTLTRMCAVLQDVMRTPEWVYGTKKCRLLEQESPSALFYYAEMEMPWPVKNRDFIIRISMRQNPVSGEVTVLADNRPERLPVVENNVRIMKSAGVGKITPLKGGYLRVQYDLHVEPGGQLPPSVVNLFMYDGPFETFKKLPSRVAMSAYENVKFPFIRD